MCLADGRLSVEENGVRILGSGNPGRRKPSNKGAPMRRARVTDFFFIGLGIVPVVLACAGLPDLALMLFAPLLIAACLCGMREKAGDRPAAKDATALHAGNGRLSLIHI